MLKKYNDLTGGLNLNQASTIEDNQFVTLKNMYYNKANQLQTRRGYRKFGNQIGSAPITSFFSHQRDDNLENITLCASGGAMYSYNGTTWSSIDSNLMEYETIPGMTDNRTRWDFAVYKNVVYMCDGVNPYSSYDGSTFTRISTTSIGTTTADSGTDELTKATHGMSDGDEVYFTTTGDMPGGLTEYQVYYVVNKATNTFQVANTLGGTAIDITSNGTGTLTTIKLTEPRCRYIQYLGDRIYGAGDDANPSSLYYTNAAPADGTNINQNVVVVGGDEQGRINAITEYSQVVLTMKDGKTYAVDVVSPSIDAIDTQTGGYADRSIANVANSLVYFQDGKVDTLVKRSGVSGAGAIESKSLSDNVEELFKLIEEKQYNASCGLYIPEINNYYFAFDTNDDNRPDTLLVYSAKTKGRSEYVFPPLYDFGSYINSDRELQYLFASASGGQMYQFEYGFDDDGSAIDTEAETKPFDYDDPSMLKVFDFVDITGYKQKNGTLDISILVDGTEVGTGQVTDSNIDLSVPAGLLGVDVLGQESLGGTGVSGDDLPVYRFTVRVPFYSRGQNIAVNIQASGVQRIWEKFAVSVEGEVVPVFEYNNIL